MGATASTGGSVQPEEQPSDRKQSSWSRRRLAAALIIGLMLLSTSAFFFQVPVTTQVYANVGGQLVQGTVDLNNPGSEPFWSSITGAVIPLTPSIPYQSQNGTLVGYGGMVSSITVKIATNQTHIFVYASWADPTESRSGNPMCFIISNNKECLEDERFPGLFYTNSTYAYEDRLVFWWSLDSTPGPPPCMTDTATGLTGEGRSLAGTGNLWHWKAGRTDSLGARYGTLKYGSGPNKGQIITPPHSYAANEFINQTGHYVLGWDQYPTPVNPGNFTIGFADNIHQQYDPYLVSAHGVYDSTNHIWKWEAARLLTTNPSLHIIQFQPGQTYYFAVAAFDGGPIPIPAGLAHPATEPIWGGAFTMMGENEETKSISSWFTATLGTPSATNSTSSTYAFGSLETAALVSLGMLAAGFVAGVVVFTKVVRPRRPSG